MTSRISEHFHDFERRDTYLDLISSSLPGSEQAMFLDLATRAEDMPAPRPARSRKFAITWFSLPQVRIPVLTWAYS